LLTGLSPMRKDDIHAAIRIVKREIRQWEEPVVGVIARESNRDPFLILISCLLSLRTKDKTTDEASHRLFALARTPAAMLKLPLKKIERAIYPVGFYRTKAKSIHQICDRLLDTYGGTVPNSIDELVTLPGVGRKTANLVVTVGYGKPGICVDIHVHRITNRWGYIKTKTPEESEQALRETLPKRYWITFNDLLVPYGQHLCQPVSPFCTRCKLTDYCDRVGVTKSR
jgi:endonuclease-3